MVRHTKKKKKNNKRLRKSRHRRQKGAAVFEYNDVLNEVDSYLTPNEKKYLRSSVSKDTYENHYKLIHLDEDESWEFLHTPEKGRLTFLENKLGIDGKRDKSFNIRKKLCLTFRRRDFSSGVISQNGTKATRGMDAFSNCQSIIFYDCYFPTRKRSIANGKGDKACIEHVEHVSIHHCRKIDDCYFLSELKVVKITEFSSIFVRTVPTLANVDMLTLSFCYFYIYENSNTIHDDETIYDGDAYDNDQHNIISNAFITTDVHNVFANMRCSFLDFTCTNFAIMISNDLHYLNMSFTNMFKLNNIYAEVRTLNITGMTSQYGDDYVNAIETDLIDYTAHYPNTAIINEDTNNITIEDFYDRYATTINKRPQTEPHIEYDDNILPNYPCITPRDNPYERWHKQSVWYYKLYEIGRLVPYLRGEYNP